MKVYVLEYKLTMLSVQFNTIEDQELKLELFTKKSELYRKIEKIQENDSIYMNYKDVKYYTVELDKINNVNECDC